MWLILFANACGLARPSHGSCRLGVCGLAGTVHGAMLAAVTLQPVCSVVSTC